MRVLPWLLFRFKQFLCQYVYIYIYIYIYLHTYIYADRYVYVCTCLSVYAVYVLYVLNIPVTPSLWPCSRESNKTLITLIRCHLYLKPKPKTDTARKTDSVT